MKSLNVWDVQKSFSIFEDNAWKKEKENKGTTQ